MSEQPFPRLFSPLRVGRTTVRNRIVITAHGKGYALEGLPNERMAAYYAERARGGVGLVVTEATVIHPTGRHRPGIVLGYDPASVAGFRRIAERVHRHGALVVGQLFHPGLIASGQLSLLPVWSSARQLSGSNEYTHAVDHEEIQELIGGFATTARHMREGGYDGVEVHAAHGYLLHQFLSPLYNTRTDDYGGSLENRVRLCVEVIDAVRAAIGPEPVVGVRLSANEFSPGGLEPGDVAQIAKRLDATGKLDYISVSAGNRSSYWAVIPPMDLPPAAFAPFAEAVKQRVTLPIITAGRINDPAVAEQVLAAGRADLVGMTRALLADPELPLKAQSGRADEIRHCIACLQACRGTTIGKPVTCVVNPAAGNEERWGLALRRRAARRKRVLVVGGGPAGMEVALVAAERGHDVVLWERQDRLGGQVRLAALAPHRDEFAEAVRWQEAMLAKRGVQVELGRSATASQVLAFEPEVVVVATGSSPSRPAVPGIDRPNVVDYWAALDGSAAIGDRVLVVDGGENSWQQCGTAEALAARGKAVEIISPAMWIGAEINSGFIPLLYRRFRERSVRLTPQTALGAVEDESVVVSDVFSGERRRIGGVDTVVLATGNVADDGLYQALKGWVTELHAVGDCVAPRRVDAAMREGFLVGQAV